MPHSPKKIYGIIGYPLKHTLSPAMHNAAFRILNLNAEYKTFEIKPEELDNFLSDLDRQNISGLNVTIPYKEKVLDFITLNKESFYLRQVRAVNTISLKNGKWLGFNTDIPGFARHLKEQLDPNNKKAAVLGAGGASRAVCYVLANCGAEEIAIFDIDRAKTAGVVNMI
jgi:shikimate dehydrogenase